MRVDLRHELRHRTRLHQRRSHRVSHEIMHDRLLAEAHFGFRGMHIHVHFAAGQLEKEQHHGIDRRRQNVAVGLGEGVLNEPVADQASIDENVNRVAIELLNLGLRDEAMHAHFAGFDRALLFIFFFPAPRRRLGQANVLQRLHRC